MQARRRMYVMCVFMLQIFSLIVSTLWQARWRERTTLGGLRNTAASLFTSSDLSYQSSTRNDKLVATETLA